MAPDACFYHFVTATAHLKSGFSDHKCVPLLLFDDAVYPVFFEFEDLYAIVAELHVNKALVVHEHHVSVSFA